MIHAHASARHESAPGPENLASTSPTSGSSALTPWNGSGVPRNDDERRPRAGSCTRISYPTAKSSTRHRAKRKLWDTLKKAFLLSVPASRAELASLDSFRRIPHYD